VIGWMKRQVLGPLTSIAVPAFLMEFVYSLVALWLFSKWSRVHSQSPRFANRFALYEGVHGRYLKAEPFVYLEFGVFQGESLRWWVSASQQGSARFVGFDVFTGLPERWGVQGTGAFDCQGKPPEIDDRRVSFQVGLFSETLRPFLASHAGDLSRTLVVHLDADLYSSTLYVLTSLWPVLKSGDIIVFDEFGSVRTCKHEFRAFHDFCTAYGLKYEVLGFTTTYAQAAIRVL